MNIMSFVTKDKRCVSLVNFWLIRASDSFFSLLVFYNGTTCNQNTSSGNRVCVCVFEIKSKSKVPTNCLFALNVRHTHTQCNRLQRHGHHCNELTINDALNDSFVSNISNESDRLKGRKKSDDAGKTHKRISAHQINYIEQIFADCLNESSNWNVPSHACYYYVDAWIFDDDVRRNHMIYTTQTRTHRGRLWFFRNIEATRISVAFSRKINFISEHMF